MMKLFCDRCEKELDYKNMKYVGMSINDHGDDEVDIEHWDFCYECAAVIKHILKKNMGAYRDDTIIFR